MNIIHDAKTFFPHISARALMTIPSHLGEPAHLIAFTWEIFIPPVADLTYLSRGSHLGGLAHLSCKRKEKFTGDRIELTDLT